MYPTVSDYSNQHRQSSQGQRRHYAQPEPPSWPPSQLLGPPQNGPANSQSNASNFPMLRVHIADHLRTSPPVMITSALEDIPRTQFAFNFEYEHQLVQRLQSGSQASPSNAPRPDTHEDALNRFGGNAFSREEIAMALVAIGSSNPEEQEVQQYCKNYRELKSMGFDSPTVVGALVVHKLDLAAATEACLSAT